MRDFRETPPEVAEVKRLLEERQRNIHEKLSEVRRVAREVVRKDKEYSSRPRQRKVTV